MKLGLAGSGMIVNELFKFIREVPEIELCAIGSTARSYEKVREIAKRENIPHAYETAADMIRSDTIDTVYLGIPNSLHYEYAMMSIENGKNLIIEKPFMMSCAEAGSVFEAAEKKDLMVFEAIPLRYQTTYEKLRETLPKLGDIKLVTLNYSQFSSRYDLFQKGILRPNFDRKLGGGSLNDLGIYNLHLTAGMFGLPLSAKYYPNIERDVDTSGVLVLDYGEFKATLTNAKDTDAPGFINVIGGNKGRITFRAPNNSLDEFEYTLYDGTRGSFKRTPEHRMLPEFRAIEKAIREHDTDEYIKRKAETLEVMKVLDLAHHY
ncbi:MAG: Gfo/Idh/MocA family oxidoreductase [Erysipelotrichales bacterium]|nr:Gfo/Idh/MocA family oxidoreductase [Erysipelotrichales bacterium]